MRHNLKPRTTDMIWLLFSVGVGVAAVLLAIFTPGHGPRDLWVMVVAVCWLAAGLSLAPFRLRRTVGAGPGTDPLADDRTEA